VVVKMTSVRIGLKVGALLFVCKGSNAPQAFRKTMSLVKNTHSYIVRSASPQGNWEAAKAMLKTVEVDNIPSPFAFPSWTAPVSSVKQLSSKLYNQSLAFNLKTMNEDSQKGIRSGYIEEVMQMALKHLYSKYSFEKVQSELYMDINSHSTATFVRYNHMINVTKAADKSFFSTSLPMPLIALVRPTEDEPILGNHEAKELLFDADQLADDESAKYAMGDEVKPVLEKRPGANVTFSTHVNNAYPFLNVMIDCNPDDPHHAKTSSEMLWYLASSSMATAYLSDVDDPLLIVGVISDGLTFYRFIVFQLNTLSFQKDDAVKNVVWVKDFPLVITESSSFDKIISYFNAFFDHVVRDPGDDREE